MADYMALNGLVWRRTSPHSSALTSRTHRSLAHERGKRRQCQTTQPRHPFSGRRVGGRVGEVGENLLSITLYKIGADTEEGSRRKTHHNRKSPTSPHAFSLIANDASQVLLARCSILPMTSRICNYEQQKVILGIRVSP